MAPTLSDQHLARALAAWTQLVGSIGFELFGHLNNVIHDYECCFNYQMSGIAQNLGLNESPTTSFPDVVESLGRAGVNSASRGEMAGQVDSSGRAG